MKNIMAVINVGAQILLAFAGFCCICFVYFFFTYARPDHRDLLFLTRCETEESVVEHFGRKPEIVYHKGEEMRQLGWKLPKRAITNKVLIYTNRSALRFYIFIDDAGRVEYVFTSSS